MFRSSNLVLFGDVHRLLPASTNIQCLRFIVKAKGKTKQAGSKQKRRHVQKARRNRPSKSNLDHAIEQSQDVLSLARPFSIYHPPPYITPELADDIVLYKDGECAHTHTQANTHYTTDTIHTL